MPTEIQKGTSVLRPRARLIKTIGEELISNDVVAVVELIKNSYDADASIITIQFSGNVETVEIDKKTKRQVLRKEGASITISDDGIGMSLETIKSAWMEPATIMKRQAKRSPGKKRRYTGEKGIGRFASAKLSSDLQIVTREAGDNEVVVFFTWTDFTNEELYLDQVESSYEVRKPTDISTHGTTLHMKNLNSDWDEEKIRSLKVALSRLINPVAPVADFLIELVVPDKLGDFSGLIEAPEAINRPDYNIKGSVDETGIAKFEYSSRNVKPATVSKDLSKTLRSKKAPISGPFDFEFRVWDREGESLDRLAKEVGTTTKNVKADLDELTGVSIYRDQFRVLPYGEPKNDWLRLNARRVNNPTMRLSDNQLVGYVSISLDRNPELKDQSNREGIVESQAFEDLQELVLSVLNELEVKRYAERPRKEEPSRGQESLYANFSISPLADAVTQKLRDDKEVLELVQTTQARINEGVRKVQDVLSRYRRLSTLGLLIDSILHDGAHFLLNIDSEVILLERELKKKDRNEAQIQRYIDSIKDQRRVLSQLFKRIQPFGGRKRGRPSKIVIEHSIKNVFEIKKHDLDRLGIETILPKTENTATIDDGELQTIIVNLLQNAMYWLETVKSPRKIVVEVEREDDQLAIIFSDNGPGVSDENASLVFDPYFTTRPDGVGLGLTIVGELAADYNGELLLVNNGPLGGATFKIIFRKRI